MMLKKVEAKMPTNPKLKWLNSNLPESIEFDDTYYSRVDGLQETYHVFINGNDILNRWQQKSQFTIAELGFGTGLNFFATAQHFENSLINSYQHLTYTSFELYPLTPSQMLKALSQWPDLANYAKKWLDIWQISEGWNLITSGSISLSLAIGDAGILLPKWNGKADAWYLDGFNPKTNKAMWDLNLMQEVFQHTKHQGTFATYTAAGWVRRNLESAGFEVSRLKGFGNKKEMLVGCKKLH